MSAHLVELARALAGDEEARAVLVGLMRDELGEQLAGQARPRREWLDVGEAAEYLRCRPQRIYDLVSAGRLRVAKDGSRSLFRREWLDAYLLGDETP